jgi:iron only hydrogenase large subunit-like protein
MERQNPIYTEKTECQDCYKCVRSCPVKAIRVENGSATVMPERCILCGHCVEVCPVGAKRVRDDLSRVRQLLRLRAAVYVSLAPSFRSEFPEYGETGLVGALKSLGFAGVSETALGAQEVSAHTAAHLQAHPGTWISTACPVVVSLIEKYHPELRERLLPHLSPLQSHALLLRREYGPDAGIVFIGPCIAKKKESATRDELVDIAITFNDLRTMLEAAGITPDNAATDDFVPEQAADGRLYPVDGGMIATVLPGSAAATLQAMAFCGIGQIEKALEELDDLPAGHTLFLELLACEGGCVNGPVCSSRGASARKRLRILQDVPAPFLRHTRLPIPRSPEEQPLAAGVFTREELTRALKMVGKHTTRDELNCGGCGYESCQDFARALLSQKAEPTMCVSWMRQLAQKKANALMKTMPSGMVIVDEELLIVECNRRFCTILGGDLETSMMPNRVWREPAWKRFSPSTASSARCWIKAATSSTGTSVTGTGFFMYPFSQSNRTAMRVRSSRTSPPPPAAASRSSAKRKR